MTKIIAVLWPETEFLGETRFLSGYDQDHSLGGGVWYNGDGKVGMKMEAVMPITADSLVKEVVGSHPQTIAVFAKHGLNCVGCYIAPFHTITDTAREYAVPIEPLLSELNEVAKKDA